MIPAKRQTEIINLLLQRGIVTTIELASLLDVSPMTIRRDIRVLEEQGRVVAVSGGAQLAGRLFKEPSHLDKSALHTPEKSAIGALAASMISPNMVVYLDAGTTVLEIAHHLVNRSDLTIVTNDFVTAAFIAKETRCQLWHTGGMVERENQSCIGSAAADIIRRFNFDLAFISTSSFDQRGVSTPSESKVAVKQAIADSAQRRVLVSDSSKYGMFSTFCALPLGRLTDVVSDGALAQNARDVITQQGVQLHLSTSIESNEREVSP
ncbi:Glycerol-3-phosphate regulon repressor [Carnimonas sp. R-84981]|uniref:DeoR/GlpR family DNA-binding transcription regulator n=1 Tax=Carnimonas bestiolae TaxID=3402172 RepID=UPI003EDBF5DC